MDEFVANICNQNQFHSQSNEPLNHPSIPIPLSHKTVDQVWFEIHEHQPHHHNFIDPTQSRQAVREMTLEDFLLKAGVVQEESSSLNFGDKLSGNCFSTCQMLHQSSVGEPSDCTTKKRIIDGPSEVVVQRRQRRMIKNRESAARSRARKQAYKVELEVELNHLKEENVKLKQIVAESERKRKQKMKQRKQSQKRQKPTERLRTMRRIASMAW